MKKIFAAMLCAVMVLSLAACGSSSNSGTSDASGSAESGVASTEDLTIAFLNVTDSLAPFPQYIKEDFEEICDENGWTFVGYDGQGDVNNQTDQVASVISDGEADLAVLFCVDSDGGIQYVEDLNEAGIPVITFGSDVSEDGREYVSCFVGPDQDDLIAKEASAIAEDFGDEEANYIVLSGWEGQYDYLARGAALENEFADTSYTMLGDVQYCGASRDNAMEYATTLLTQYGSDIDFIVCFSDEFALGAQQAVEDAGLTDSVKIYSVECFAETLPYIEDGTIEASVTMTSQAVADKLAEVIPSVVAGESIDYTQSIEQELVTVDNAADYEGVLQY